MQTPEFIHVISWILIAIFTVFGLLSTQYQQIIIYTYINRALYLVLVLSGLLLMVHTVAMSPFLIILKFFLEIGTIVIIEFLLQRTKNNVPLKNKQILMITLMIGCTSLLGTIIEKIIN